MAIAGRYRPSTAMKTEHSIGAADTPAPVRVVVGENDVLLRAGIALLLAASRRGRPPLPNRPRAPAGARVSGRHPRRHVRTHPWSSRRAEGDPQRDPIRVLRLLPARVRRRSRATRARARIPVGYRLREPVRSRIQRPFEAVEDQIATLTAHSAACVRDLRSSLNGTCSRGCALRAR